MARCGRARGLRGVFSRCRRLCRDGDALRRGRCTFAVRAESEIRQALQFYRSVGATRYIEEGEALLAATARRRSTSPASGVFGAPWQPPRRARAHPAGRGQDRRGGRARDRGDCDGAARYDVCHAGSRHRSRGSGRQGELGSAVEASPDFPLVRRRTGVCRRRLHRRGRALCRNRLECPTRRRHGSDRAAPTRYSARSTSTGRWGRPATSARARHCSPLRHEYEPAASARS